MNGGWTKIERIFVILKKGTRKKIFDRRCNVKDKKLGARYKIEMKMQKYGDQEKIAGSEHQVTGCAVVRTDGQLDHSEHRKRVESSVLTAPAVS